MEYPMNVNDLSTRHCQPRKGEEHALGAEEAAELLKRLPGWQLREDGKAIVKDFKFKDFHHTLGFINVTRAPSWCAGCSSTRSTKTPPISCSATTCSTA